MSKGIQWEWEISLNLRFFRFFIKNLWNFNWSLNLSHIASFTLINKAFYILFVFYLILIWLCWRLIGGMGILENNSLVEMIFSCFYLFLCKLEEAMIPLSNPYTENTHKLVCCDDYWDYYCCCLFGNFRNNISRTKQTYTNLYTLMHWSMSELDSAWGFVLSL